jgi:hypothetical protein
MKHRLNSHAVFFCKLYNTPEHSIQRTKRQGQYILMMRDL